MSKDLGKAYPLQEAARRLSGGSMNHYGEKEATFTTGGRGPVMSLGFQVSDVQSGDDDVKSEVEVMAVRPEEDKSEDEEGGEVEVGTDAERLRAEKADGYLKRVADPRKPTEQQVKDHYRTHVPYRNWCPCCVKANGKDLDHRKAVDGERGLNEYTFDYCFPGDEFGASARRG